MTIQRLPILGGPSSVPDGSGDVFSDDWLNTNPPVKIIESVDDSAIDSYVTSIFTLFIDAVTGMPTRTHNALIKQAVFRHVKAQVN